MKSVGELLKSARQKKKISRSELEKRSKIKLEFIEAIETSSWNKLPEYPTTAGFIKSLCSFLGVEEAKALAVFRRDYPKKALNINPKPDAIRRLSVTPQMFLSGILFSVIIMIFFYLSYQLYKFSSPPSVDIFSPADGEKVTVPVIKVSGNVDRDSSLTINNQPVLVSETGNFETDLFVNEETKEVIFVVKSRSGKETKVVRKIEVGLD